MLSLSKRGEGSGVRSRDTRPGVIGSDPHPAAFGRHLLPKGEGRSAMANPILIMKGVGKRFPGVVALRGVSLKVGRADGHVLLGENGAGKSTLINLLAGVYQADEGQIVFDREPYRPRSRPTPIGPASASFIRSSP
jgi:ABC-type molybdenum transport system ATPase subunit/photorepair protein PhrA